MAITVTSDTIVKIIVRNGTNTDRLNTILSLGELGYASDTGRLFIGDGKTAGGNTVGVRNFGIIPNNTRVNYTSQAQIGDLVYDNNTLYTYTSSGWFSIDTKFDNDTIKPGPNNTWSVNTAYLSGNGVTGATVLASVSAISAAALSAYNTLTRVNSNSVDRKSVV